MYRAICFAVRFTQSCFLTISATAVLLNSGRCALGSTGSAVAGSATDCSTAGRSTLFAGFQATMTESDFSCPCIIGYGSSPSRCGPPYSAPFDDDGQTRDIPGSGAILLHVMWPLTPAGRQHLAWRCRTCCLRANENSRPLRCLIFRGSTPHPTQLLCTLRDHCHQRSRNTRYQAGAAPYLGRSSTGWIAPACLAHSFDHLVGAGHINVTAVTAAAAMIRNAGAIIGLLPGYATGDFAATAANERSALIHRAGSPPRLTPIQGPSAQDPPSTGWHRRILPSGSRR